MAQGLPAPGPMCWWSAATAIDEIVKNDIATRRAPADHRHHPGRYPDRERARDAGKEAHTMLERKTVGQLMEEMRLKAGGAELPRP